MIPHVGGLWKYMLQVKQGLEALGHQVDMMGDGIDCFYMYGEDNRKVLKSHFKPMLEYKLPTTSLYSQIIGSGMPSPSDYFSSCRFRIWAWSNMMSFMLRMCWPQRP